jgi:hypothetical protein
VIQIVPMTLRRAPAFVAETHRHHRPPQGGLFAVGAAIDGDVIGVAICGRPVSRLLAADPATIEITRLATDGSRNACSALYGAAWRAARALGYRRAITYTLASEPGTSLRGAGWMRTAETSGGSWDRSSRGRTDKHPTEPKVRWEVHA